MSYTVLLFFEKAKTQPQKDKMVHTYIRKIGTKKQPNYKVEEKGH